MCEWEHHLASGFETAKTKKVGLNVGILRPRFGKTMKGYAGKRVSRSVSGPLTLTSRI